MPFELDKNLVGYVLFFPYVHRMKIIGTDVPGDYNQPGSLVIALIPFSLSQDLIAKNPPFPPLEQASAGSHHKLQVVRFSSDHLKYLKAKRSFTVFADRLSERRIEAERFDQDTQDLIDILKKTGSFLVPCNAEARMIFIHVRAIGNLHRFPRFVERRAASTQVQFYIYGTHPDLSPSVMPVQEVYPCGLSRSLIMCCMSFYSNLDCL